jgi:hypothetical protein
MILSIIVTIAVVMINIANNNYEKEQSLFPIHP